MPIRPEMRERYPAEWPAIRRCHNRHDAALRRANAEATRRRHRAAGDLFGTVR